MNWLAVLLILFAATRVTHFLADDFLIEPIRSRLVARLKAAGDGTVREHLAWALTCTWCMSIWVSAPATALAWWQGWLTESAWLNVAFWPGLSYGIVLLEALVEKLYGSD